MRRDALMTTLALAMLVVPGNAYAQGPCAGLPDHAALKAQLERGALGDLGQPAIDARVRAGDIVWFEPGDGIGTARRRQPR